MPLSVPIHRRRLHAPWLALTANHPGSPDGAADGRFRIPGRGGTRGLSGGRNAGSRGGRSLGGRVGRRPDRPRLGPESEEALVQVE